MSRRQFLAWYGVGLAAALLAALLQPAPGYMDAEYYYAQGMQLAKGAGFYEPFLWNYLDNPLGIPHPAFTYWMPLPALLAAAGMRLTGSLDFFSARLLFILLAGLLPPLTVYLTYHLTQRRQDGWLAGGLAALSGFYTIYLTNTEGFTLYMLLGIGYLLAAFDCKSIRTTDMPFLDKSLSLGLVAGLLHLTRADGILWLMAAVALRLFQVLKSAIYHRLLDRKRLFLGAEIVAAVMLGYGVVMCPWYLRNLCTFGSLFPPGGTQTLWLTDYDQMFRYPADSLNFTNWLAAGWPLHVQVRLDALGINLKNALAVEGTVFLTPLILLGLWRLRKFACVRFAGLMWLSLLAVMTVIFPFAGSRGGFIHSTAALQPLFWAAVPAGLDGFIKLGVRRRNWQAGQAWQVFASGILALMAILSGSVFWMRVRGSQAGQNAWLESQTVAQQVEQGLVAWGAHPDEIVMVNNPPGYFVATGRSAIVIPDGDTQMALAAARRYHSRYLVLEANHVRGLDGLYQSPEDLPGFDYLGSVDTAQIFEFSEDS